MTKQQAIETAKAKFSTVAIETLQDVVIKANDDLSGDMDFVLDAALGILEERMDVVEFCNFCDSL